MFPGLTSEYEDFLKHTICDEKDRWSWEEVVNWKALAESGTISDEDLELFRFVDTADEAVEIIETWQPLAKRTEIPGRTDGRG